MFAQFSRADSRVLVVALYGNLLCSSLCFLVTTVFRHDLWFRRRRNKLRSVLMNSAFGPWLPWYDATSLGFLSYYPWLPRYDAMSLGFRSYYPWLTWYDATSLGFRSYYPVASFPSLLTVFPNVVSPIWQHNTGLPLSKVLVVQRQCYYHCWKHRWDWLSGLVFIGPCIVIYSCSTTGSGRKTRWFLS